MATYTDHHQAFHDNWGRSDLPSDHEDPQVVSIPEVLNHGSISFGKYAAESLAWEKWSVFSHNRCQEELEKFNGLVAQKKAYFEEYYRRLRALKAAEAEAQKQETTHHLESYQYDLTATSSAEESIDDTGSKEEEQTSVVTGIQLLDTGTTDLNLSGDGIENKSEVAEQQRSYCSSSDGEASVGNEVDISLSVVDLAHSPEMASLEAVSWTNDSSEAAQQNDLVSDTDLVDLNSSKHEDQAPVSKPKGTVASARDRAELDCRTRNNVRKSSERLKPTSQKKLAGNACEKVQLSRKTTPKPAGNMRPNSASSHRPLLSGSADDKPQSSRKATPKPAGNMRPNSASSHRSSLSGNADDKLQRSRKTTPKPAGNMRTNSASSHRLPTEVPTRSMVLHSSIAGDKSVSSVSSVSTIRSVQTNIISNPKFLPQKSTSRLSVNTLSHSSVQSTPKQITRNVATENRSARSGVARKSVDITSCNMTPKGGQSEKQRPKAMSTAHPTHIKSNQHSRIELLHGSYDREHQKEGKDQINAGQRNPKRALSNAPSIHKPPSPRPKKITPLQYAELMQSQREPRPKTLSWR